MNAELHLKATVQRATLAESVYDTLLEAIVSGRLPAGTPLSVVQLAKQLQVSRTPVHEALRHLARDGLVVQEVNRKARVAEFTSRDVYEIFEMRKLLEGAVAERAAERIDRDQLAQLRRTAEELAASTDSVDWWARWIDFDEDFHEAIAAAAGNKRLLEDIGRYRLLHRGFNRFAASIEGLHQALGEHQEILRALEARDPAWARRAMVEHLEAWQRYFVENFPPR